MTTQATPRPWMHYDDTDAAGKTGRHEIVATGKTVARIYRTAGSEVEDAANAALIVRAVNCHDELVAALRDIIAYVEGYAAGADSDDPVHVELPRYRAALAKADPPMNWPTSSGSATP